MLLTLEDLIGSIGGAKLTEPQKAYCNEIVLPGVQGELETHLNRPIEPTHVREVRPVSADGYLELTVTPVISVNFIMRTDGQAYTLPPVPNPAPVEFQNIQGMRNMDLSGNGSTAIPERYFVGRTYYSPMWPLYIPSFAPPLDWICDYIAGWNFTGEMLAWAKKSMAVVAGREVERMFVDGFTTRGGLVDSAQEADSGPKYWSQDEFIEWDRYRRRVIA